ncbi:MAG: GlsB/YeaQ/YmgE family stress response membrane protein [Taibaiella sp.]|nr:GlsB/YeaQ/YmgE family stress response membrane protein [Taibaiella sp.]
MDTGTILTYIILGAIAGTAAAALVERSSKRKGQMLRNTIIGILGAFVGNFLFSVFDIGLPAILSDAQLSLADVLVAFIGAIIVIFIIGILRR